MRSLFILLALALALTGCETAPRTETPNDQAALCIQGVTMSRKAATALLRAGKITIEKDQAIQASLDSAVPGCKLMAEGAVK